MRTMNESEVAYVAGIMDGEGCLNVRRIGKDKLNRSSLYCQIQVTNTNKEMLDYLKSVTGLGIITGPYLCNKDGVNRRPYWKWIVRQSDMLPLLVLLRPWLIVKRKVTSLVFALRELQNGDWRCQSLAIKQAKEEIYAQIKEANRRGFKRKEGELLENPERTISSQAEEGILPKVQRLEAEARTASNASTSALPERDEIV